MTTIERPGRKRLTIEVACTCRKSAARLEQHFGGHVRKLPRNWLTRLCQPEKNTPIRIGKRLVIINTEQTPPSPPHSRGEISLPGQASRSGKKAAIPATLVIPAGAAFGTGQHPTTAMSLRLLEQLTRPWTGGWKMVDLGTGSGIFALGAKLLGAGAVVAVDNDPVAISTAKGNARLNNIAGVRFQLADVLRWRVPGRVQVIVANLFSELLIPILPQLAAARWLILSGVLREQERHMSRALKRNGFGPVISRRRGKWIAVLTRSEKSVAGKRHDAAARVRLIDGSQGAANTSS